LLVEKPRVKKWLELARGVRKRHFDRSLEIKKTEVNGKTFTDVVFLND